MKTDLVTLVLVEDNEEDGHDHYDCHQDESVGDGLPCLGGCTVSLLMEWGVHTEILM